MEHSKTLVLKLFWLGIVCLSMLSGCKKPEEPHPENLDQIYADLTAQAGGLRAKAEGQKKKIEEISAKAEKYGPRDPAAKQSLHEKENLERGLQQIEQDAQYFEIRAEQRRIYDKESYLRAYKADETWPPEGEFAEYKEAKRLKNVNRDWSKNVPVDSSHNKPVADKKKKKEEKKAE